MFALKKSIFRKKTNKNKDFLQTQGYRDSFESAVKGITQLEKRQLMT